MSSSEHLSEPYTVRAHHYPLLLESYIVSSPAEVASQLSENAKKWRGDRTKETVDFDLLSASDDSEEAYVQAYAVDLIGDTAEQTEAFHAGLQGELIRFSELEDSARIRFGAGVLDAICGGCAFKKHCQLGQRVISDLYALTDLEETAKALRLEDEIQMGGTKDEPTSQYLDTTVGTARRILLDIYDRHNQPNS